MKDKYPKIIAAGLVKKGRKYLLVSETLEDGESYWIVPGGKVEYGETLEQAVKRETKEEVGIDVLDCEFLVFKEAVFPNNGYHTIIFFYLITKFSGEVKLEGKILEAKFFTKGEALKLNLVNSARWLVANHLN